MEKLPAKRQNLLFSATLDEEVEKIIDTYFITPQYLELIARGTPLDKITQSLYFVPNFYTKVNLLQHLVLNNTALKKVLVFCKNKNMANDLYKELEPVLKNEIAIIHSNKTQPQRFEAPKRRDIPTKGITRKPFSFLPYVC